MWLEETISPSASTRLEAGIGGQQRRVAPGPVSEAEVLPHRDMGGAETAEQHFVDERLGALRGEGLVERDDHELADTEAGHKLGLGLQAGEQPGLGLRPGDGQRVRFEGEHRVVARDHLTVAEVDTVELAHRDPPRPERDL